MPDKPVYRCSECGEVLGEVARMGNSDYPISKAKRLIVRRDGKVITICIGFSLVTCQGCGHVSEWLPGGKIKR